MDRRTFIKGTAATAVVACTVGGCREKTFTENPNMAYRALGKTGLRVSVIGFGTEWMERQSDQTCAQIMRRCEALGINLFDCWMGGPAVRSRIGEALRGHRHQWIIQGHVGDLAVAQPSVPDSVRQHYLALKHHASECKECDQCEKRCPFHVKIVERMQKAATLFGV